MEPKGIIKSITNALNTKNVFALNTYPHTEDYSTILYKTTHADESEVREFLKILKEILIFGGFFNAHDEQIFCSGSNEYPELKTRILDCVCTFISECAFLPVSTTFCEQLIISLINNEAGSTSANIYARGFNDRSGTVTPEIADILKQEDIIKHPDRMSLILDKYARIIYKLNLLDEIRISRKKQIIWLLDLLDDEQNQFNEVACINLFLNALQQAMKLPGIQKDELIENLIINPVRIMDISEYRNMGEWIQFFQGLELPGILYKVKIIKSFTNKCSRFLVGISPSGHATVSRFLDQWYFMAEYYKEILETSTDHFIVMLKTLVRHELPDLVRIETMDRIIKNGYRVNNLYCDILQHLYVRHETPYWFIKHFFSASQIERQSFFHLAGGTSIRYMPEFPYPITRKEAHQLATMHPSHVPSIHHENWIPMGILFARLLINGNRDVLVNKLLGNGWALNRLLRYPGMLDELTRFAMNNQKELAETLFLGQILDYLDYRRSQDTRFSFCRQEFQRILNQSNRWHEEIARMRKESTLSKRWEPVRIQDYKHEENGVTYNINQILEYDRLYSEGRDLKHCVSSYAQSCRMGSTAIFSLNCEDEKGKEIKLATLQISDKTIIQAKGKCNRNINLSERKIIRQWAFDQGLRMAV